MRFVAVAFLSSLCACAGIVGFEGLELVPDTSDAGDGGSISETGPVNDGGGDEKTNVDGATKCFDGIDHDYCFDFENQTAVDDGWAGKEVVGTGLLELATPPAGGTAHGARALHSFIDRSDAGTSVHIARVSRQDLNPPKPDGTTRRIKSAFDLYVDTVDVEPYVGHIYTVVVGNGGGQGEDTVFLRLARDADAADVILVQVLEIYLVDGNATYAGKTTTLTMREKQWTHIEVVVNERLPGTNGGIAISVGDASDTYQIASSSRTDKLRVDFGWGIGTLSGAHCDAVIDNVTVDFKK